MTPHPLVSTWLQNKTHPLNRGGNNLFGRMGAELAEQEFKRCMEFYNEKNKEQNPAKIARNVLSLYQQIQNREFGHHEKLQELSVNIIRELFDVPPHLEFNASICQLGDIKAAYQQPEIPFHLANDPRTARKERVEEFIQKRLILNALIHGSSMHLWKSVHHIASKEIETLSPGLLSLYDQYISSVGLLLWFMPPILSIDLHQKFADEAFHQGMNSLQFKNDDSSSAKATVQGIMFPVLLNECNKTVFDYISCHAIPEDFNSTELKYIYSVADNHIHEPWHYFMGPSLWTRFLKKEDCESQELPGRFMNLCLMTTSELTNYFK